MAPFIQNWGKSSINSNDRKQISGGDQGWGEVVKTKGSKGTFGDDGDAVQLDCGDGLHC